MPDESNVLLTCSGRKSYLVSLFSSSPELGTLVTVDSDPMASTRQHAEWFYETPRIDHQDYVPRLLELCQRHSIHCVIPQNDLDLIVLANAREQFAAVGSRVAGADREIAPYLRDKLLLGQWMDEVGLPYPPTWLQDDAPRHPFPQLHKARFGQGSEGLGIRQSADSPITTRGELVFQPVLHGTEYTLDILRCPTNGVVAVIPIQKLETRWGSASKTVAVHCPNLIELGVQIGQAVRHLGPLDVDVFVDTDGAATIIDLNARIGGCFPFAAAFSSTHVDQLLQIARGADPECTLGEFRTDLRADKEFRFFSSNWQ